MNKVLVSFLIFFLFKKFKYKVLFLLKDNNDVTNEQVKLNTINNKQLKNLKVHYEKKVDFNIESSKAINISCNRQRHSLKHFNIDTHR